MSQTSLTLNLNWLLEQIFEIPAPIVLICGRMGMGKTDFSLLLAELLLDQRMVDAVATNIEIEDPRFTKVTSVFGLERWLATTKGRKLFILDEAGIHIDSRTPFSQVNRRVKKIAMLLRHYRGKLVLITQRGEKDIESALRDLISATITKLDKYTAIIALATLEDEIVLHNIPRTSIKFDTWKISEFNLIEEPSEEELTRMPECCRIRILLEKHNWKYRAVALELDIHSEDIRRLLIKHLLHIEKQAGFNLETLKQKTESKDNNTHNASEKRPLREVKEADFSSVMDSLLQHSNRNVA
jgi:hypothetical protein